MTLRRIANSKGDTGEGEKGDGGRKDLLRQSIDNLKAACMHAPTEPTYHNNLGLSQFEDE